ncbi:hypothetical protein NQ317_008327 [Molorchus minor]|uniref:Peptidase aspartic putative domain-containing protein n=1 Tax=Molorchus minor TaxID=1323400 RepID=A0ABQ9JQJ0_9CUCU|nr:hypothetical protein NQ317_008327 [Molorchus minor]
MHLPICGINQASIIVSNSTNAKITSLFNAFEVERTFLVLPEITSKIPNFTFGAEKLKIPSNLTLADPKFNISGKIDMLLGADIFFDLLCVGQVKIGPGQPILQKSQLGWILSGPISIDMDQQQSKNFLCNFTMNMNQDFNLERQLEKFWNIEELPSSSKFTREELACEKHFVESIFDPLGLVGPAVIKAKIMLQRLWQTKIAWDESLSIEMFTNWINFIKQIPALNEIKIERHVVTQDVVDIQLHDNPADIISRGIEPSELVNAQLWWQGPTWLSQNAEAWPETLGITLENEFPETRKANVSLVTRLSDYTTDRNKRILSKLSNKEIEIANLTLIKLAQSQEFGQELHNLEQSQSVSHNSKLLSLNPFLDSDKIIRVGGRISNAPISYDRRHPIVLPEKHPLTKLIIKAEHHKQLHAGAQAILAALRLQYWPLNGKRAVRSVNYVQ